MTISFELNRDTRVKDLFQIIVNSSDLKIIIDDNPELYELKRIDSEIKR